MKKLLFSLLLLTSCGFTPLYSKTNNQLQDTQIIVNPIPNQYGDQMRRVIQNELHTSTKNPINQYRLIVNPPSFSAGDKTISANEFASMMQITGSTSYYIENIKTGKIIYSGDAISVGSYAVVLDPYATTVAQNHIHEELSKQLAQQVALDVVTKLSEEKQ